MPDLFQYLQAELNRIRPKAKSTENKLNQALYTSFYSPFMPIQAPSNYTSDLVAGYMDSETVYSIVNKIADTASSVPIKLYNANDDEIESHWSLDLLQQPNADTSFKELVFNYYVYLLSIGNSFMYGPKLERGIATEIWTMPSDLVEIISGPFYDPVIGYKFKEGNQEIVFEKSTVLHGKLFNPRFRSGSWQYGLSPISVAAEIIATLESGNNAMEASFVNGGPAYIITSQLAEGLTPQQQEMLEQTYKKKFGGAKNANKSMLSGTPLKVEKLGISPVDLNIIESSRHGLRVMCNVYGVPSVLFNDNEQSTYNNVEQARKDFYQFTIQPLNETFAQKLKQFLIPGEDLHFKFDYSDIEVLQESFYTRSLSLQQIQFMTPNEKREALGLPRIEQPEMDMVWQNSGMSPIDEMGMDAAAMDEALFLQQQTQMNGKAVRKVELS